MECCIEKKIKKVIAAESPILLMEESDLRFYLQPAIPTIYRIEYDGILKSENYSFSETLRLFKKYLKDRIST